MPPRLSRFERFAVLFWIAAGFVVWNGVFDLLVSRGAKEYLYQQAQHELGLAERASMELVMSETVRSAVTVASLWGGSIAVAGVATVLLVAARARPGGRRPGAG